MAEQILADTRHTTREEIKQAIRQRTTRGMLTFNTDKVQHLEGELWAVPSTRGGFHQVDLANEVCDCEDYRFFGRDHGIGCRHVYAAAIANAARRSGVKEIRIPVVVSGDPFKAASRRKGCPACFGGYATLAGEDDNGHPFEEAVPCRRCNAGEVV